MAIKQQFTQSYKSDLLGGHVAPTNTYKIALYTSAADLDHNTGKYTTTNEVVGTGYTAGGKVLSTSTSSEVDASGVPTGWRNFGDATWTNATFTARGALLYILEGFSPSVMVLDFGGDKTVTNGTFRIQMPAGGFGDPDGALIQIR